MQEQMDGMHVHQQMYRYLLHKTYNDVYMNI